LKLIYREQDSLFNVVTRAAKRNCAKIFLSLRRRQTGKMRILKDYQGKTGGRGELGTL